MNLPKIILASSIFAIGHVFVWIQMFGQIKWPSINTTKGTILLSIFGAFVGWMFIVGSKMSTVGFEGNVWPARLMSQSIGIIVFSIVTQYAFGQPMDYKTWTSIILACIIILIQFI